MSSSTSCNPLHLAVTFSACVTSAILVIVVLTSPSINSSYSSSLPSNTFAHRPTGGGVPIAERDSLVSDSLDSAPDVLLKSSKLLVASRDGQVNASDDSGDKNTVYTSDDSTSR